MISLNVTSGAVEVWWEDGVHGRFHYLWLRDNCPQSKDPSSGQRLVETIAIPESVKPESVCVEKEEVVIVWSHDRQESRFQSSWLRRYCVHKPQEKNRVLWGSRLLRKLPEAEYSRVSTDERALLEWLLSVRDLGFGILRDAPKKSGAVVDVVRLFGSLRESSLGRYFDVMNEPDSNSVACTGHSLPGHTDDPFHQSIPSLLIIQCLEQSAFGGESVFADGFNIAASLRREAPHLFDILSTTPICFEYSDADVCFSSRVPLIELSRSGEIRAVRYSNHTAQPFDVPFDEMIPLYAAYRKFGMMCKEDRYKISLKLNAGDVYVVDNWRILHGRSSFSGRRYIEGCFGERDEVDSKIEVLLRKAAV